MTTTAFILIQAIVNAQGPADWETRLRSYAEEFGGRVGLAAKSIATGETIAVNADTLFPTASVIKLPVLVELFYQFGEGTLTPNQPIKLEENANVPGDGVLRFFHEGQTLQLLDIATLMIILSDNTATNYVIDQLGKTHDEKLEAVNTRMRVLGLKNTKLLNKLYSVNTKKNTEEARRFGIGVSSPGDMVLLLEKLVRGEVVNKATSDEMIGILKNQMDKSQAARFLPFTEDTTLWVANKTGSLDDRKIDVGIVSSAKGTYVYAIFCDNSADLGEQSDNMATLAVAKISRLLYEHYLK